MPYVIINVVVCKYGTGNLGKAFGFENDINVAYRKLADKNGSYCGCKFEVRDVTEDSEKDK